MRVRISTLGAAFSANKGAASMAQAVVDVLPDTLGPCDIDVLTTYPSADASEKPQGVRLVSLTPRELVLPVLPIALLAALIRLFGGSGRSVTRLHPATNSLARADMVLDLAGISFADGRSFPILVYNVLMTGVPLLIGAPVVKCSQAVGPFRTMRNRNAAKLVLPRLRAVLTRGEQTHQHAIELGLSNAARANDLAFLMKVPRAAMKRAEELVATHGIEPPFIMVMPSSVVKGYCTNAGLDYVAMMARFIRHLRTAHGLPVVVAPHSARPERPESRMNDLPVCREIHDAASDPGVHLVDENLRPAELRALIGCSDALVTSRFHAMISALATSTPLLVVGWSHKYEEVLGDFALTDLAVPYDQFTPEALAERFDEMWSRRADVVAGIDEHLPAVLEGSHTNFEVIRRELERRSA